MSDIDDGIKQLKKLEEMQDELVESKGFEALKKKQASKLSKYRKIVLPLQRSFVKATHKRGRGRICRDKWKRFIDS